MSELEDLLSRLMSADLNKSSQPKTRRSPQERAFNAAKNAVFEGNFEALSRLVKTPQQANWYAKDRHWCLLDEAVKSRSSAMVQWLLEKGANPNTLFFCDQPFDLSGEMRCGFYFSPFASAIASEDKQIIQLMLAHGADINLPVYYQKDLPVYFRKNIIDADQVEDREQAYLETCRDLARNHGVWPWIEGLIIGQAVEDGKATCAAKRL